MNPRQRYRQSAVRSSLTVLQYIQRYNYTILCANISGIIRFSSKYFFFVFKWNPDKGIYDARTSKTWIMAFLFKCIVSTIYLMYQLTNIHLDFLRQSSDQKLSSTIVIDYFWVLWALLPFYYNWGFLLNRDSFLSAVNSIINLTHVDKLVDHRAESVKIIMAKYWMLTELKYWKPLLACNTLTLSALFIMNGNQRRYIYYIVPAYLKQYWITFACFFFIEAYTVCQTLALLVSIIHLCLGYPIIAGAELLKVLSDVRNLVASDANPTANLRAQERKLTSILKEYNRIRLLNTWYNCEYGGMATEFNAVFVAMHTMFLYMVVSLYSFLPIPTLLFFSFWGFAMFPMAIFFNAIYGDLVKMSEQIIRLLKHRETSMPELRRYRYLKTVGIGGVSFYPRNFGLRMILYTCRCCRGLLLLY